jgi:hypothetical protein
MIDRTRTLELAQPLVERYAPAGWKAVNARSNCRNYFGICYHRSRMVSIAGHLHDTEEEVVRTTLHEIAHALDYADEKRMTFAQRKATGLLERTRQHDARFLEYYYRLLESEGLPLPGDGARAFD